MLIHTNIIACATALFVIGVLLNGFEAWMIVRHSRSEMRVYSQILLQICVMDILTLVIGLITQPVSSAYGGWVRQTETIIVNVQRVNVSPQKFFSLSLTYISLKAFSLNLGAKIVHTPIQCCL